MMLMRREAIFLIALGWHATTCLGDAGEVSTMGEPPQQEAPMLDKMDLPGSPSIVRSTASTWQPLYLRCSENAFVDSQGRAWLPAFNTPRARLSPVNLAVYPEAEMQNAGGLDDLYREECFSSGPITFSVPVPKDTSFEVTIYMAETKVTHAGARILDISLNNNAPFMVDIYSASGGANTALVSTFTIPSVPEGVLVVRMSPQVNDAKINALSIVSLGPAAPALAPSPQQGLEVPLGGAPAVQPGPGSADYPVPGIPSIPQGIPTVEFPTSLQTTQPPNPRRYLWARIVLPNSVLQLIREQQLRVPLPQLCKGLSSLRLPP
eukprot:jgi/Botrbrau1/18618/Bobra.0367s0057.1